MLKHTTRDIDLTSNLNLAYSAMIKALALNPIQYPGLFAIPHDAYAVAMKTPYSSVLRLIFQSNIILFTMHEMYIHTLQQQHQTERLIQELKDETSESESPKCSGGTPERTTDLQKQYKELKEASLEFHNELIVSKTQLDTAHRRYISAVNIFVISATKSIEQRANKLGYKFNEKELAILNSPVSRSQVEQTLKKSYIDAGIQDDLPKTQDFSARSLPDLELRTLMALNAYWNRQVNEMTQANCSQYNSVHSAMKSIKENANEQKKSAAAESQPSIEKSAALEKLRADFKQKYEEESADPQKTERRLKRDSRVFYSVKGPVQLLREFSQTFDDLESKAKAMHSLHQGNIEDIQDKMRQHIESHKNAHPEPAPPKPGFNRSV